ncbi:glucokinase, partial [Rhizopus stolonifer]
ARLAGAAMASLIEQQQDLLEGTGPIVIGVNGSTYEKYPTMHHRIYQSLAEWFGSQVSQRIKVELATDGGSIGGALIAMLAEKEEKKRLRETFVPEQRLIEDDEDKNTLPSQISVKSTPKKSVHAPPPPSLFGCLFGWLTPLKAKKEVVKVQGSLDLEREKLQT